MSRAPPPSNSAPPVSRDVVEVVKRKIAAPSNPPPPGMMVNFNAPKEYKKKSDQAKRDERDRRDNYDDDRSDDEYHRENRSYNGRDDYRNSHYDQDRDRDRDRDRDYNRDREYDRQRDYERDRDDRRDEDDYDEGDDYYDSQDEYDDRRRDDYDDYDHQHDSRAREREQHSKERARTDFQADGKETGRGRGPGHKDAKEEGQGQGQGQGHAAPLSVPPIAAPLSSTAAPSAPTAPVSTSSRLAVFNFQPILRSTYRELRAFVTSPCAPGVTTRCYIERNRSGSKMLAPFFSLCADLEDGTGRELMVCRKVMRSRSAHYVFSLKAEDLWRKREQRSRLYLGKLRAVSSTDYILYDNGICAAPDESDEMLEALERGEVVEGVQDGLAKKVDRDRKAENKGEDVSLYRRELLAVHFSSRSRPAPKGTRGMEVCLPIPPPNTPHAGSTASVNSTVKCPINNLQRPFEKIVKANEQNRMYKKTFSLLHEKCSRYDPLSACLVDFRGRAHMASVKNFQLVLSEPLPTYNTNMEAMQEQLLKQDADKDFFLQMGKTTEDCFNMDFRHPLSLLQAFAVCIARFDANLKW